MLSEIQTKGHECKYSGHKIVIKPCLSQAVRERIWALNAAYELVQKHPAAENKTVERKKDSDRCVTVDGVVAFDQTGKSGTGFFTGPFANLVLPGRASS